MSLEVSKGQIIFISLIGILTLSAPLWLEDDSEPQERERPLVDCKFESCGVHRMTSEQCAKAICCNLFSEYKVVKDSDTCKYLQSEAILKAVIKSHSNDTDSGYDAGYYWAEDNDIDSVYYCDGNSDSFNEGCAEYVCEMAEYYPRSYECY